MAGLGGGAQAAPSAGGGGGSAAGPSGPPVTGRFSENRPQLAILLREEVCLGFGVRDTMEATRIEAI